MTIESSEPAPLTDDELARLPVFPLPRVVFFPGTFLPLHLFEPRYRAMAEACMEGGPAAIAIALLRPGFQADYEGRPPVFTIAGAGRIVAHEKNDDGTHDIVLSGLTRVSLEELPNHEEPFRRARATPLRASGLAPATDVQALLTVASTIAGVVRRQHPEFSIGVTAADPPERIIDAIADRFVSETPARQEILEELSLSRRAQLVLDAVGELMAMLGSQEPPS